MVHAKIEACIFDMDGLLINSEHIYTEATNEVLKPYGKEMTWEIKSTLMGCPAPVSAQMLIDAVNLPLTVDELLAEMDVKLRIAFARIQPMPGVLKLVRHLKAHGIPVVIGTGSKTTNFVLKQKILPELFDLFGDNYLCGDDPILGGKGKPDPTIFIEAAKKIGVTNAEGRSKTLVFEDGAPGIKAARAAGMEAVWVPDVELVRAMGNNHGVDASLIHESLEHFVPEDWGLPPY